MIALGDMGANGMRMLVVLCRRRGRLSIKRLIAEDGRDGYDLRWLIAHDCPRMRDPPADSSSAQTGRLRPRQRMAVRARKPVVGRPPSVQLWDFAVALLATMRMRRRQPQPQ
jgi:hypothetical protein